MENKYKKIGMISLGCDKNRVDTENVLYTLSQAGYIIVQDSSQADIILINTCAFIDSAKKESIDTILEFAEHKTSPTQKIVVLGCLAERYANDISGDLPSVDAFVGINSYHKIVEIIENLKQNYIAIDAKYTPYIKGRIITTPMHYAYLKIADGCDNFCTYCAIPKIRGRYRSEKYEDIIAEAKNLAAQGVREIIVVAQDTTRYGFDIYGKYRLKELLLDLSKLPIDYVRLMYVYPELVDKELIDLISTNPKICKYVDMPLQHIDQDILKLMHRRSSEEQIRELIKLIKNTDSSIIIRSSFIVGFPGETDEQFNRLKDFILDAQINYAGFFAYSKEDGTIAAKMPNQIPQKTKKIRVKELEKIQSQNIVNQHNNYLNSVVKVIYEGIDYKKGCFVGRMINNAPDIDTKVYFTAEYPLDIGMTYDVKITETGFNLSGMVI